MKASKKVMESVIVSGLALTLTVTAVTGNGVGIAAKNTVADTKLVNNGIAGVASAMNEYELESADYLDRYISVEKTNAALVAATADGTVISENDTNDTKEETVAQEPVSEEEQEWQDKLMANVDDFLYVREKADSDSKIVGKMYKGDRAVVKEAGDTWTKIQSGNVTGYVKNEYCVTGTDALNYAKKHCDTVAKVSIDGLRVRKAPDTDAGVVKTAVSGDCMDVNTKAEEKDGWIAVKVGSDTCYVSEDYVTVTLDTGKAVTIEEEQAAIKAAEEKKAKEEAKKKAAASAAKKSSSGQSASSQTTQNASIAASADEETLLAALVQCEAGGTSVQCMTAVGAVVVNRVRSGGFANSIYGVIYQSGQFGPASSGRLEARLASGVSASARQAARAALNGSDPTGGARYFKLASSGHAGTVVGPIVFY